MSKLGILAIIVSNLVQNYFYILRNIIYRKLKIIKLKIIRYYKIKLL